VKFIADPPPPSSEGRCVGRANRTLKEARPTHTCVASIPTSLPRRRAWSGAHARGSREERRLITIRAALGPATSQYGRANNKPSPRRGSGRIVVQML